MLIRPKRNAITLKNHDQIDIISVCIDRKARGLTPNPILETIKFSHKLSYKSLKQLEEGVSKVSNPESVLISLGPNKIPSYKVHDLGKMFKYCKKVSIEFKCYPILEISFVSSWLKVFCQSKKLKQLNLSNISFRFLQRSEHKFEIFQQIIRPIKNFFSQVELQIQQEHSFNLICKNFSKNETSGKFGIVLKLEDNDPFQFQKIFSIYCKEIQELDLTFRRIEMRNNHIDILETILPQIPQLFRFELNCFRSYISRDRFYNLMTAIKLKDSLRKLVLMLANYKDFQNEDLQMIAEILKHSFIKISKFEIIGCDNNTLSYPVSFNCFQKETKSSNFAEQNSDPERRPNLQQLVLNFSRHAKINDNAVIDISKTINGYLSTLKYLKIEFEGCFQITDHGVTWLGEVIGKKAKNLLVLHLNFGRCLRITNQGFHNLCKNISLNLRKLESIHLKFSWCELISQDSAKFVSKTLDFIPSRQIIL